MPMKSGLAFHTICRLLLNRAVKVVLHHVLQPFQSLSLVSTCISKYSVMPYVCGMDSPLAVFVLTESAVSLSALIIHLVAQRVHSLSSDTTRSETYWQTCSLKFAHVLQWSQYFNPSVVRGSNPVPPTLRTMQDWTFVLVSSGTRVDQLHSLM